VTSQFVLTKGVLVSGISIAMHSTWIPNVIARGRDFISRRRSSGLVYPGWLLKVSFSYLGDLYCIT